MFCLPFFKPIPPLNTFSPHPLFTGLSPSPHQLSSFSRTIFQKSIHHNFYFLLLNSFQRHPLLLSMLTRENPFIFDL